MLPFLRREQRSPENRFLVLDIGTEFVKALICETVQKRIVILGAGKKRQGLGDMQSGAVMDIAGVIENAAKAIEEAAQEAGSGSSPSNAVIGIAGELVKGMTYRATFTRKEPNAKIDANELKQIIHKMQWKSFEETRSQIAYETGFQDIEMKLVNAAIVDSRIDGYKVSNPLGFQGKEAEIAIFNAFAPLVHFGALQTIAAELELNVMATASEPYALARCIESDEQTEHSAIFIDVGGGATDIAVVQNGALEGTKMFTLGGRTFTKRLAHTLNVSFQEAENIKIAYTAGKLEKQAERVVREAVSGDMEVWIAGVSLTLSEFSGVEQLPPRILLCGGGSHLPEIKAALEDKSWTEELPFPKPPVVSVLTPKQIPKVQDATLRLINPEDTTPVALARLGLEHEDDDLFLPGILKKVIRLMEI